MRLHAYCIQIGIYMYIVSFPGPRARWCPMPLSLPHSVSFQTIETGSGLAYLGLPTARVGVNRLFFFAFHISVFYPGVLPFTLPHMPLDFTRVSIYLHPFGRNFTLGDLLTFR